MKRKHICPVCGFDGLKEEAFNAQNEPSFEICPQCHFEPGFDGENDPSVFKKFRERWMNKGHKKR